MGRKVEILSDTGLENLRYAIVRQAALDYYNSLKFLRNRRLCKGSKDNIENVLIQKEHMKKECESFFRSGYYGMICDLDGELIMTIIRRDYYNRQIVFDKPRHRKEGRLCT